MNDLICGVGDTDKPSQREESPFVQHYSVTLEKSTSLSSDDLIVV